MIFDSFDFKDFLDLALVELLPDVSLLSITNPLMVSLGLVILMETPLVAPASSLCCLIVFGSRSTPVYLG